MKTNATVALVTTNLADGKDSIFDAENVEKKSTRKTKKNNDQHMK